MKTFGKKTSKTLVFTAVVLSTFFLLTLTTFAPTASAQENQKQIRVVARSSNDTNWQIVTSGAFGSPRVSAERGENLILLAADPNTGNAIPKDIGTIEGHIISESESGSALLQKNFEVPAWARSGGASKSGKAKSWSSKTLSIISNLNRGTKFARKGGVKLPITKDFPEAMAITIDAPSFKPLTFKLTVGGKKNKGDGSGSASAGTVSGIRTDPMVLKPNEGASIRAVDDQGNLVEGANVVVNGTTYSNPASIIVPDAGQIAIEVRKDGETVYPTNPPTILKVGSTTGGGGEEGGGSGIPWAVIGVVIAIVLILYIAYARGLFERGSKKGTREEGIWRS